MRPDVETPVVGTRFAPRQGTRPDGAKSRLLVVEDDQGIREPLAALLSEEGYEIALAENGQDALGKLRAGRTPDLIVLDLRMPVMDGWEFRAIQKQDPTLGLIPVVAISADASAQAVAISADAYLRKPLDPSELLRTIERILFDREWRQMSARLEEAERLASLGRVAAGVGHEINNPLAFVVLNLEQALGDLRATPGGLNPATAGGLSGVVSLLEDCQNGLERIRCAVGNLQRLSRRDDQDRAPVDIVKIIEQSVSMAWNQIRHRARFVRRLGAVPSIQGNAQALGQVFLNLLVNAAQAIPEGNTEGNEIAVGTKAEGDQIMVEIRDTGGGIAPEILSRIFDPFFTTKAVGTGTGLGLFVSRQTVTEHGGHVAIESHVGKGTVFRVFLPCEMTATAAPAPATAATPPAEAPAPAGRSRIMVIDDEPAIGGAIRAALRGEHDVFVVQRAAEAFARLAAGETFDLVLCDLVMPDIGGPEVYATINERWPALTPRLIFMTGGAFTDATGAFIDRALTPIVFKPFRLGELKALVRKHIAANN
jgi:signal transduction histidine kinase